MIANPISPALTKPLPWSHTALSDYITCPKQYFHKRVAKDVVDVQNEAALWGDRVHKALEAAIKAGPGYQASLEAAGEGMDKYAPLVRSILSMPHDVILPEQQLAITSNLTPCDWFDSRVWCRGIVDVLVLLGDRAYAADWKTGKRKLKWGTSQVDDRQLKLFALLIFLHYPQVRTVKTEYVWVAAGMSDAATYHREQEGELWQEFLPDLARYKASFKAQMWPAKKSGLCNGWCPVKTCPNWAPPKK